MSDRNDVTPLTRRGLLGFAALALALPAGRPAAARERTMRGTVSYRERIALPPYAILQVSLVDVSLADAPTKTIAFAQVRARNRMPIPYRLRFDDKHIIRGRSYALEARILVDGKLWFTTTTRQPVYPRPLQPEIVLERVAQTPDTPTPHGKWLAESIRGGGVIDNLQSTVEIAPDGKVSGNGGCNGFGGKATITGERISFGPLVATQKACAPAVMDQETKLLAALNDAKRWLIDDERGKLILFDANNREILLLARM